MLLLSYNYYESQSFKISSKLIKTNKGDMNGGKEKAGVKAMCEMQYH